MYRFVRQHFTVQPCSRGIRACLITTLIAIIISVGGCTSFRNPFAPPQKSQKLDDETVRQYPEEWQEVKLSVQRLTELEKELSEFLKTVNQLAEIGTVPGEENAVLEASFNSEFEADGTEPGEDETAQSSAEVAQVNPSAVAGNGKSAETMNSSATMAQSLNHTIPHSMPNNPAHNFYKSLNIGSALEAAPALCADPMANNYKKSMGVIARFPRMKPKSSNVGGLESVEAHLPMLLAGRLMKHEGLSKPRQIRQGFASAQDLQQLAREKKVQFLLSGEVDDLSMAYPNNGPDNSFFNRLVSGVHDVFSLHSSIDKRERVFSFDLHLHDGITGQVMFSKRYTTYGKWSLPREMRTGFGSIEFWRTPYGQRVKSLVDAASDELAQFIRCQPFFVNIHALPGQYRAVVHGGKDSGLRPGDQLELYRIAHQAIPGDYRQVVTRLVKETDKVYITETYSAHSIAQLASTDGLRGYYVVGAH